MADSATLEAGTAYSIQPGGTDMIVTMGDGSVASYDPGDM